MAIIVNLEPRRRTQTQGMWGDPAVTSWIRSQELGAYIRSVRLQRGIRLRYMPVHGLCMAWQRLAHIEKGEANVEYQTVRHIAEVLREPRILALATRLIIAQLDPEGTEAGALPREVAQ